MSGKPDALRRPDRDPFRVDQEARARHLAAQVPTPPVVPAPEHTSRDPWPADIEVPRGLRQLGDIATTSGWSVTFTYSRGPWLTAGGEVAYTVHGIACRGELDGRHFHALYIRPIHKDKWACDHVLLLPRTPAGLFPYATVTDLKDWIMDRGSVPLAWYKAITARIEDQRAKAKATAKDRPKRARQDMS